MTMTNKACEWIELDIKNYQLSYQTYLEDETKRNKVNQADQEMRIALEDKPIDQDEKTIIEAAKHKFMLDMEMFRKLQTLKYTTAPQAQAEIQNIELSKISDALSLKFGFDLSHYSRCFTHFKLSENKEIASYQKMILAQKQSEEKKEFAAAATPKETVEKMIKEAKDLGEPQYKSDGTMTFDYFLDTMRIINRYTFEQTRAGLAEYQEKRRTALKEKNEEEYQKLILKCANWEQLSATLIQANLY